MPKRMTTKSFIVKAKAKHDNVYDYTKVVYKNNKTKIIIGCQVHGEFEQTPGAHLVGQGCRKCGVVRGAQISKIKNLVPANKFFEDAIKIHNGKYSYLMTDFRNMTTKISINCPEHGEFTQLPCMHKRGVGCPECGQVSANNKNTFTKEDFIEKAKEVHGNYYNYDDLIYTRIKDKLNIACPVHGKFKQSGYHHLKGSGCSKCATSGFNPAKPAILYYLSINDGEAYKIGITGRSVQERFSAADLCKIEVLFKQQVEQGYIVQDIEKAVLHNNREKKYTEHNLLENGNTELFKYCVLDKIKDEFNKKGITLWPEE